MFLFITGIRPVQLRRLYKTVYHSVCEMGESNNVSSVEDVLQPKRETLRSVKDVEEKVDRNSWGYVVGFGTIITFVSIFVFGLCDVYLNKSIDIIFNCLNFSFRFKVQHL